MQHYNVASYCTLLPSVALCPQRLVLTKHALPDTLPAQLDVVKPAPFRRNELGKLLPHLLDEEVHVAIRVDLLKQRAELGERWIALRDRVVSAGKVEHEPELSLGT